MRLLTLIAAFLLGCPEDMPEDADILVVGDSLMDFNRPDEDVASVMSGELSLTHAFAAAGGTTLLGDERSSIGGQYVAGPYRVLLVSGGGNDLGEGCQCGVDCDSVIDQLLSSDSSSGVARDLVDRAIADGLSVVWVGYMRPMPDAEEFSACGGELDIIRDRMAAMDQALGEMVFVDGVTVGDGTDPSMYAEDGYHPSPQGSEGLGLAAAEAARQQLDL